MPLRAKLSIEQLARVEHYKTDIETHAREMAERKKRVNRRCVQETVVLRSTVPQSRQRDQVSESPRARNNIARTPLKTVARKYGELRQRLGQRKPALAVGNRYTEQPRTPRSVVGDYEPVEIEEDYVPAVVSNTRDHKEEEEEEEEEDYVPVDTGDYEEDYVPVELCNTGVHEIEKDYVQMVLRDPGDHETLARPVRTTGTYEPVTVYENVCEFSEGKSASSKPKRGARVRVKQPERPSDRRGATHEMVVLPASPPTSAAPETNYTQLKTIRNSPGKYELTHTPRENPSQRCVYENTDIHR